MDKQLSDFGNLFIKSVRDDTLFVLEGIIRGHMKSSIDKEMHEKINTMSVEEVEFLKEFAYRMVDLSLHNMLLMFQDNEAWIISNRETMLNLADISDGLAGELYSSDGWISKFSEYKTSKGL